MLQFDCPSPLIAGQRGRSGPLARRGRERGGAPREGPGHARGARALPARESERRGGGCARRVAAAVPRVEGAHF